MPLGFRVNLSSELIQQQQPLISSTGYEEGGNLLLGAAAENLRATGVVIEVFLVVAETQPAGHQLALQNLLGSLTG